MIIALSYLIWFVCDTAIIYLVAQNRIESDAGLVWEAVVRFVRLILQQASFMWIMVSFQRYGVRVDKSMQREKRRSSMRQPRPVPTIVIDKLDSTTTNSTSLNNPPPSRDKSEEAIKLVDNAYEPNNNSQAKRSLLRADTINEEDLTLDKKGSGDSSDDSDEWSKVCDTDGDDVSITMEEKML